MNPVFEEKHSKQVKDFGDFIIKAGPPKNFLRCNEDRPTIPNVHQNSNIAEQCYHRTIEYHHLMINEIKTRSKIMSFAMDIEHDIEVC